jgi:hypothetical protein
MKFSLNTAERLWLSRPIPVSREFREQVLKRYPALAEDTERAWRYRRIAEYCFFPPYYRGENDEPVLLFRFHFVAALVGLNPKSREFESAEKWIREFSADVFDLRSSDYRYVTGMARDINPDLDPAILAARSRELAAGLKSAGRGQVYFVDGSPVSVRKERQALIDHRSQLEATARDIPEDHPAGELLVWLNSQPPDCLDRVLKANWPAVVDLYQRMPEGTDAERQKKHIAGSTLMALQRGERGLYIPGERTPRLYTRGAVVHSLCRELRKAALKGCIHLDLKACGVAVAARVWEVPPLQEFLSSGGAFWEELLSALDLEAGAKPRLKTAVHSLCFGRGRDTLGLELAFGVTEADLREEKARTGATPDSLDYWDPEAEYYSSDSEEARRLRVAQGKPGGIGRQKTNLFLKHPFINGLFRGRKAAMDQIEKDEGAEDAFGRWIPEEGNGITSVLAQQVQSYEMRMMLQILPVIQKERDIRILCWLHDGVYLRILDPGEAPRKVKRLCQAVNAEASRLGIHTRLVQEH